MRIFITGGGGFIGQHLVRLLTGHHDLMLVGRQPRVFHHPRIDYLQSNLHDPESWKKKISAFNPNACIHLAWDGLPDYSLENNLRNFNLSLRLYQLLIDTGCRRIFTSGTCWEYGRLQGKVCESDMPETTNLFASFKTGLRLAKQSLAEEQGINWIWGRLFFVYGPGQRNESLIPYCYHSLKQNRLPELSTPGAVNDFIHVEDAAAAIMALIETPDLNGVFNIGTGIPENVTNIRRLVAKTMTAEDIICPDQCDSTPTGNWADISLITQKTNWKPVISLESGINNTIRQMEGVL